MKILEKRYPLGTIPKQQTDGRYINKTLEANLDILAESIIKDMTYLGIITSSTLEVGTGKSVFAQQIAEAYLERVRKHHGIDNKLSMKNLVFRPQDIIERSFEVPKYSVIICDEWEDQHYWSELGKTLRQFFRKCRQLNLFILIIIPNFFQLPMSYAISRSVFLIDVQFKKRFDRGYFSFYNFHKKKNLFLRGKKTQDYDSVKANFTGRFVDGYVVNEEEYRKEKMKDLMIQEENEKKPVSPKHISAMLFYKIYMGLKEKFNITIGNLSFAAGFSSRTGDSWLNYARNHINQGVVNTNAEEPNSLLLYPTQSDEEISPTPIENVKKVDPMIEGGEE